MQHLANFEYEKLLSIYLEDRRQKGKITSDIQLRDLQLKSRRELTTAGRFYIKKGMYAYAIDWLQRAGNDPQAQQVLGLLYLRKPHLALDSYQKAKRLLMASKTSVACFTLGTMYNDGLGVSKDRGQAIRWFVEGGLKGLRRAKYQAGLLYFCDAQTNLESAKLAYYWLSKAKKKRGTKNDMAARKLRDLIKVLDCDIVALAKGFNPYRRRRYVYHSEVDRDDDNDNDNDDEDDNDDDDDGGEDDKDDGEDELGIQVESSAMVASSNMPQPETPSFVLASDNYMIQPQSPFMAQPESSFMAASNDMMQSQSSFIPFNGNIVQPEPSFMPLSNSNTNMVQQSESARIRRLEELNKTYRSTIKKLEDKLHIYRSRGSHIHKLENSNKVLRERVGEMEKLFYAIAENETNNPYKNHM